ncbi:MAG: hypothetical protein ACI4O5_01890 [Oscillospiraceae bacterium]
MSNRIPRSPFSTRLSGSAKETELRIRNIFQWKKKRPPVIMLLAAFLAAALCGGLVGFTAAEPSAADAQTPDPSLEETVPAQDTTVPAPAADANREVLDYVEALFENEKDNVNMQCFLLPGTGPIAVTMDEYHEQVCAVFAQYTWTREEEEEPEWERSVDDWTLYLNSAGTYNIVVGSYSTRIRIDSFAQTENTTVYYSYDGEPGSLNDALADLWEGPEIRYALVTLPESVAGSQTLAEAYEGAFRELYLASDAITDYELLSVELLGEDPGPATPTFTLTYRVKPVDPTASCWEYYAPGEDGWVTCSVEMHLNLVGYESIGEWVWRAAWWEYR